MKSPLCKCNNCDSILIDRNPQTDAIEHELKGNELQMVFIYDRTEKDYYWACPKCETDDYLTDFI